MLSLWTAHAKVPPPVRVAVIGEAGQGELASLVAVELSQGGAVTRLEREELAEVGDELALRRMAGNDAVALGKRLSADGLIFINSKEVFIPCGPIDDDKTC